MAVQLWESPSQSFKSNLDGRLASTNLSVTLVSASGLVAPGVIVIDRQDGQGNNTFEKMEYISFTGISTNTVTGLTRGRAGTTAIDHNSGALVECFPNVTHWTDLVDFIQVEHEKTGTVSVLNHVRSITFTGISGASGIKGDMVFIPGGNASIYAVSGASGHSYVKLELNLGAGSLPPLQVMGGLASGTNLTPLLIIEDSLTINSISAVLNATYPASGASLIIDINKNFTSVFTDQNTRLSITGGGTFSSTASIGTRLFTSGDIISLDIDSVSWGADLLVNIES